MEVPSEVAGHVFISYVREDSRRVDRLQQKLQSAGITVWRDTADLWPGEDWRAKIRQAITSDALVFIACFSKSSLARRRSYQNEELHLAIQEMRLRRPDEPWLIPVRFDECEIPDFDIGANRTLTSIQRVDLFGRRFEKEAARLVIAVLRVLGLRSDAVTVTPGVSARGDNDKLSRARRSGAATPRRRPSTKSRTPESLSGRLWQFLDSGPLTIVCPQLPGVPIDTSYPSYSEAASFAYPDALMDLYGHVRAENPAMTTYIKAPSEVYPDDLTGHVVLLGDTQYNGLPPTLPVIKAEEPTIPSGRIFTAEVNGMKMKFSPTWSRVDPAELFEDVGLLCRVPNPLNSDRTLTICNGIYNHGVYGAVRSLTDARLSEVNTRYIVEQIAQSDRQFGILMAVSVIKGKTMTPDFLISDKILYQWPQKTGPLINPGIDN